MYLTTIEYVVQSTNIEHRVLNTRVQEYSLIKWMSLLKNESQVSKAMNSYSYVAIYEQLCSYHYTMIKSYTLR